MAMERDDRPKRHDDKHEFNRNEALARYDAHPGIAVLLLALMAFLFIVVAYQFVSDRAGNTPSDHNKRVQIEGPNAPGR
jgi:hypothetical protein